MTATFANHTLVAAGLPGMGGDDAIAVAGARVTTLDADRSPFFSRACELVAQALISAIPRGN